ncbi:MAG: tRNA (N6-isopentenyl adenosine(37)-C2)-methylthiotransferase MiaB [Candidatus Glassbacteria bacterium RIFCSPLOWO2_12_FULL_58_11]|uniref:tRNA-2-methylthio-N(6)-dimethylallyladenosine synthase n=1 Tax=Candidatus Glassbacteria bacterium RIFCSPLOWO2_12_FULL_58_11 TaxID=1817867 RepID=A0A1F5YNF3_9BACT|nr:MAG: tRNA (N6-isopentenyl adenosine(37)-C2)-methylthiotransferase MiaB [Candidatus Glassbacteria bacterium RIFCSPLOWO2_12_FULL_58_11]
MKKLKTFFLETYGCQMNFSDSELVEGLLIRGGLTPASEAEEADLILVNTCGVREHAEQRVFGRLGLFKTYKEDSPHKLLAVIGCMAQRIGEQILEQAPWVDLVLGPDGYRKLPQLIEELTGENHSQLAALAFEVSETYEDLAPTRKNHLSAWVPISRGCDNFCSYCIVPYVRGRERSVNPDSVERQVREQVAGGALEIVLLGQNVNSYRYGDTDFAALLRRLDGIEGLRWIRFLTSHPRDLSDRIIEAMADCEKVCEHLHLPVQSGSDRVLGLMNRGYSRAFYLERVAALRERIPGLGLTTDILVGFPGESNGDFGETVSLMNEVQFDYAYTFKYSPRPGTVAARKKEELSEEEKSLRLDTVIQLQRSHTRQALHSLRGRVLEALPVQKAKSGEGILQGKTRSNFNIFLSAGESCLGRVVRARVSGNTGMNLLGELAEG